MRTLAGMFRRRDDEEWPARERPAWPRPPVRNGFEDPRDAIPVRWLPVSNSRDQLIDSKLAAYLSCAASEDSAFISALHSGYHGGYHAMRERTGRAWREYMSALLFGYWPEHEGRLALPAPDVRRPGHGAQREAATAPSTVHETPGPGDTRILPTVRVGGVHLTLDSEPLPDLPRSGVKPPDQRPEGVLSTDAGPGQPDATVSFAVTGETQPFDRYAALRPENLDAENEAQP